MEHLRNLEYLKLFRCIDAKHLRKQNLFHMDRHIGEINDLDDLYHTV